MYVCPSELRPVSVWYRQEADRYYQYLYNMGSFSVALSVFAVILIIGYAEAGGSCPLASKVPSCSPKCVQNYECTGGKLCCRNSCNAMSCAEPVGGSQGTGGDKYGSSNGAYCDNQKCSVQEVCKVDPSTKRKKCVRT